MDTTGQGCGEKERRFGVNIYTQLSPVHHSNPVNNLNKTLYNVNSLNETLHNENGLSGTSHNVNSVNETILSESTLQHGVKCMYTNARSIINKLISLESGVAEYNPDVIGITESCATENDIQGVIQ